MSPRYAIESIILISMAILLIMLLKFDKLLVQFLLGVMVLGAQEGIYSAVSDFRGAFSLIDLNFLNSRFQNILKAI